MNNPAVISMDIGGTNIRLAIVSKDGAVIVRSQLPCRVSEGRSPLLEAVRKEFEKMRGIAQNSDLKIAALGVGFPGLIDRTGTVVSSVNLKPVNGFNLQQWLESVSGIPSIIINDANAAAVAEMSYGAGRPFSSVLHLTLGTGVGSGLILDGKLWTGGDGVASEFGHVTVEPNGQRCQCGNLGCLEQYASAGAITGFAKQKIVDGVVSSLGRIAGDSLEAADVASAAYGGDLLALECFSMAGRYLGIACASAVNMLNLDAIIFGGGVSESFDLIAPAIRKEVDVRAFHLPAARVKIVKGELGDNAGIMGAAAAAFSLL